jgi:hypothetical protein
MRLMWLGPIWSHITTHAVLQFSLNPLFFPGSQSGEGGREPEWWTGAAVQDQLIVIAATAIYREFVTGIRVAQINAAAIDLV